nr:hypothetical protein [Tanacetum cinerariifolium]
MHPNSLINNLIDVGIMRHLDDLRVTASQRNKADLDTMSIDDLYNTFKIVEQEVKRTVVSRYLNMAFLSSPGSTNEVDTASIQVSTASTPVSIVSSLNNTANLSDATMYDFLANQPNGSQLVHEHLEQIHEDDQEEIDLKWQLALLSIRVRRGLASVEVQLVFNKKNEVVFCDQIVVLKRDASFRDSKITALNLQIEKIKKEKQSNQIKINNFKNASKSLDKLIGSQITNNSKTRLGFTSYNAVAPPPIGLFAHPTIDLSYSGIKEFKQPGFEGYRPKASKSISVDTSNEIKKASDAPIIEDWVSNGDEDEYMTRNISYLTDFKEHDGGYVAFGGAKGGKITGKGTIKTGLALKGYLINDGYADLV